ncbi:MAG: transposase family protein [Candidatus Methanoplasma sp.]|nr:transposase family protein [Candidatus Methanoplasma sp.]
MDDRSRCILEWRVDDHQSSENVTELHERTFVFWKIKPRQILSDHGTEFYSLRGGRGRSALDLWCGKNGIEHIFGRSEASRHRGCCSDA